MDGAVSSAGGTALLEARRALPILAGVLSVMGAVCVKKSHDMAYLGSLQRIAALCAFISVSLFGTAQGVIMSAFPRVGVAPPGPACSAG